jgi:hypothetical protein
MCQLGGAKRIAPHPEHTAKAAGVMEPQYSAIREYEIDVIVFPGRHADWQYPETAGHTQMNHQGAVAKGQQEILRSPRDFKDFFAANLSRQTMGYRPAEFPLANVDRLNDRMFEQRLDGPPRGLNFGELRHQPKWRLKL